MSKSDAELLMFGSLAVLGLLLSRQGDGWNLASLALGVASLVMFGYTLYKRHRGSATDDPEEPRAVRAHRQDRVPAGMSGRLLRRWKRR